MREICGKKREKIKFPYFLKLRQFLAFACKSDVFSNVFDDFQQILLTYEYPACSRKRIINELDKVGFIFGTTPDAQMLGPVLRTGGDFAMQFWALFAFQQLFDEMQEKYQKCNTSEN